MVRIRRKNGASKPLRVFVGTSANGEDAEACAVLEYTLRKHATVDVEIEWMALSRDDASPYYSDPECDAGWMTDRWVTPWSGFRWAVPELCGWSGTAVYLDCPQIVTGDIAELSSLGFSDGAAAAVRRTSTSLRTACIVWNCAAAKSYLPGMDVLRTDPNYPETVARLLVGKSAAAVDLPVGWGVTDVEFSDDPARATGSVHCENMQLQPHVQHALRRLRASGRKHWLDVTRLPHYCEGLVKMFGDAVEEAAASGYNATRYVPDEPPYPTYAIRGVDGADLRKMERMK